MRLSRVCAGTVLTLLLQQHLLCLQDWEESLFTHCLSQPACCTSMLHADAPKLVVVTVLIATVCRCEGAAAARHLHNALLSFLHWINGIGAICVML